MRILVLCLMSSFFLLTLTGCVPGDGTYSISKPAGFFWGIWHGWIAPISLIWGLFNENIRVYEPFNTGWWYDFGFYIAVISGFGGVIFNAQKTVQNEKRISRVFTFLRQNDSVRGPSFGCPKSFHGLLKEPISEVLK